VLDTEKNIVLQYTFCTKEVATSVQTLIFSKDKFTPKTAKKWAKNHNYKFGDVDITADSIRLRQQEPGEMKGFRTIDIRPGVQAVIGKPKESNISKPLLNMREAIIPTTHIGRSVDVILLEEGLGNKVNMNYYGPECLESAPAVFNNKPAFLDHASAFDNATRPERSVKDKAGYYTNVRIESLPNGHKALLAKITFDESEAGCEGLKKAIAAIKFKGDNPSATNEYVGLSINAQGETEKRTMKIDGKDTEVNYVLKFVEDAHTSVDIVTVPARGGKFVALLESISGRKEIKTQEAKSMLKSFKKLISQLKEAAEVKTPEELKTKMGAILTEAEGLEDEIKKEDEADETDEDEVIPAADHKALKDKYEALAKKHEDIGAMIKGLHKALHDEPADEEEGEEDEAKKKEEETKKKEDEAKKKEELIASEEADKSVRLVDFLLKEAGIPADLIEDKKALSKKNIKAIEAEIARQQKIMKLATDTAAKTIESEKSKTADNSSAFGDLQKKF